VTYFLFAAVAPMVVLAWSGRVVAATSPQARRKLEEAGVAPASAPPSLAGAVVSGLVVLGAVVALALLTL
jgi:hypothetical protein